MEVLPAMLGADGTPEHHGLHTVPVTERQRLAALARAAGLRLSPEDLEALLPAWKRYVVLVEDLRAVISEKEEEEAGS